MNTQIGKDVSRAVELLENEELVSLPTETVYGLAANGLKETATKKIFAAKNRPFFDPLILHCKSVEQIKSYSSFWNDGIEELFQKFSPGPLTVLLPKSKHIPDLVSSGLPKAAFRIPKHPLFLQVLEKLDFPLAAPSANPFGYVSPTTAQHVFDQLQGIIPYILDGGPCEKGLESTIIEPSQGKTLFIKRLGAITKEQLEDSGYSVILQTQSSSSPVAPGLLDKHYSPKVQFLALSKNEMLANEGTENALFVFFDKAPEIFKGNSIILSPNSSLELAAKRLFAVMREADNPENKVVFFEWAPNHGLGLAINDRLRRASAK